MKRTQVSKSVFVNGTFDILHLGHLALLNYAKSLGDTLFVAIDSDERIKLLKGPTRPIYDASQRKTMLLNLKAVDKVEVFSSDEELEMWIKQIKPAIMVVGSDWHNKIVIGSQYAKRLEFFERIDDYSSTKIISYIINR
jgi:D-beta-D-heptose 7-phosphate kinase/D-beta-D-heptose 1-phosphate adenosyltransferase